MFILATTYFLANDKIYKSGAKLYNAILMKTISEGITSFTLSVSHVFSTPTAAMPSGINIDVALEGVVVNARDGNISKERAYMDMLGLVGSYHEHDIFEKIDNFSSVSAVRALQVASANAMPIHRISAANMTEILPSLQVSPEIKTDIQNAINAGKEVTISQTNVQINDWSGVGYIIKDPILGSGAYMISGGLAGGDSTSQNDGMRVVELHKDPGGWVKDNIDPQTRNTIVTAAELNVGELLSVAEGMVGMGYSAVNQCVGLVRIAYWAGGICIDMWSPWPNGAGSCGQRNLVQKHHITGTNGVSYFYNLADHLKVNPNDVRTTTNDPLVGDLVFWDNTWDKNGDCFANDERTHVGIVKWAPDEFGTLRFVHASSGSGVSTDNKMNISAGNTSTREFNTVLRNNWKACVKCGQGESCPGTSSGGVTCESGRKPNQCTQEEWDRVGKLSGQLFSGFATIRDTACTDSSHH